MGAKQEATVTAFQNAWGDGKTRYPDKEKVLSLMSEDAVWELAVPNGPIIRGQKALREEIERQVEFSTYMRCGPLKMVSDDTTVFTERADVFTVGGKQISHKLIAVYEIDANGKIRAWREYFDTADLAKQMGVPVEELEAQ